jgi:hypothetical protein
MLNDFDGLAGEDRPSRSAINDWRAIPTRRNHYLLNLQMPAEWYLNVSERHQAIAHMVTERDPDSLQLAVSHAYESFHRGLRLLAPLCLVGITLPSPKTLLHRKPLIHCRFTCKKQLATSQNRINCTFMGNVRQSTLALCNSGVSPMNRFPFRMIWMPENMGRKIWSARLPRRVQAARAFVGASDTAA